jgi:hypothetical protein
MNLYLVDLLVRFIRMIFVTLISLFNFNLYYESGTLLENDINNVDNYAVNTIVIDQKQNNNVTSLTSTQINKTNVKTNNANKQTTNNQSQSKKVNNITQIEKTTDNKILTTEKVQTSLAEYTGKLTGYGPDCVGCSGTGNLACRTKNKKTYNLYKDGIYYEDSEYGKVRILSAAIAKFKCGTIVVITKPGMQPFTGIVLDTGGDMTKAWNNGIVWMDLAYSSVVNSGEDNLLGTNIKFSVQRWGW